MTIAVTQRAFLPALFRWELRSDPELLAELRLHLRHYLAPPAVPADVAADMILCLHEAAANAQRAAGGGRPVEVLVWEEGDVLRACVRGCGAGFRTTAGRRRPRAWQTHGRGLYLMRSLMDSVEIDCSNGVTISMSKRRVTDRPAPSTA